MKTQLLRKLRAIRRRLQWVSLCRKFFVAVKWMAIALLLLLIASRLVPWPIAFEQVALGVAGLSLVFAAGWAIARPIRLFDAAVRTDEVLGLRERLSTALAISHPVTEPEIAVLRDAAEHAAAIHPRGVFRFDASKDMRRAAVPMLALCAVWWLMPQFDLIAMATRKKAAATAVAIETKKEAAKKLEDLADKIKQTAELRKPAIAEDMQKNLNALAKKLEEQKIEPEKAMASVAQMQDRIAARKMEIEKNLAMANDMQTKGLGKHTQDIAEAMKKGNFAQAAKMMDE
ncbi:MAG: hypothetical protein NTX50_23260, partial [Candidatus Sumerlaeota bacterium]|nr:hypothetical protein [Candidatus Sumerlaeota bacterium]